MSRPLRIEVAGGGCYQVTARGVERRAIFREDPRYRALVDRAKARLANSQEPPAASVT